MASDKSNAFTLDIHSKKIVSPLKATLLDSIIELLNLAGVLFISKLYFLFINKNGRAPKLISILIN